MTTAEAAVADPVFEDSAILSGSPSDSESTPAPAPSPETEEPTDPVEASVHQYELNATSVSEAAYFRFENGALVPANGNELWHLAIRRTQFQTNSGTSGPLNVGAGLLETTDYATVTQCTGAALTYDATLPASGAPGSQPYSGNAVLNSWYNYDAVTHVVTSKKQVYLLNDGVFCYKFQILNYASGLYIVLADALDL
jgi:hypothetical protein